MEKITNLFTLNVAIKFFCILLLIFVGLIIGAGIMEEIFHKTMPIDPMLIYFPAMFVAIIYFLLEHSKKHKEIKERLDQLEKKS